VVVVVVTAGAVVVVVTAGAVVVVVVDEPQPEMKKAITSRITMGTNSFFTFSSYFLSLF
jgi:zinc transporter ZupT